MRILMNAPKEKLDYYARVSEISFAPLASPGDAGGDAAALVVRGETFTADLAAAVAFGVPVVVVAGTESGGPGRGYAAEALAAGVPPACVLVKKGDKVVSLDGKEYGPAAARGIGLGVVLKAAAHALENRLMPDPLVWEEEGGEETAAGLEAAAGSGIPVGPRFDAARRPAPPTAAADANRGAAKAAAPTAPAAGSLESMMDLAAGVVAVFRSVAGAGSGAVARDIAAALGAAHLEISPRAGSYVFYGKDFASALRSGRYLYCDGEAVRRGGGFTGGGRLVAEVDPSVPDPRVIDAVYRRAAAVVHVVSADGKEASLRAVRAWVASGWRLDAVVPDDAAAFGWVKEEFGDLACEDAGAAIKKLEIANKN